MEMDDHDRSEEISSDSESDHFSDFEQEDADAFQKIKDLVAKTTEMQDTARERNRRTSEELAKLTQRLNDGDLFLRNAKKQIDNVKLTLQNDRVKLYTSDGYAKYADVSTHEIEEELAAVKRKLGDVHNRLDNILQMNVDLNVSDKETYKDAVNSTIAKLEKLTAFASLDDIA